MPNHVHLIAVPETSEGLSQTLRETHRRYSLRINRREGWRGFLWQGRFFSFPMDDANLLMAARYIELNPVRAGLVKSPQEHPWSSAAANMSGKRDRLMSTAEFPLMVGDWSRFLMEGTEPADEETIHSHERSGRPLGGNGFISELELELGRSLRKAKPGPKGGKAESDKGLPVCASGYVSL